MNIKAGVISGFTATVVLSILMVMKAGMGIMPELNVIKMLAGMMNAPLAMGWVAHFTIGTFVWGILFAALVNKLPGGPMKSAIIFSIGVWILMMIGPLPMAGAGLFGLKMGIMAPVATLVLHLIWGAALGWTYKKVAG
ncbi:MAG: hypothetical protein BMS9Abin30_0642 [Gammaproteobacteria bacterium]|nr:MAG: hypothetical protein BMS9Abin30_0642 [Gammaproteobacteria bacterium]